MEYSQPHSQQERPTYPFVLREIASSMKDLLNSELALARAEMKATAKSLGSRVISALVAVVFLGAALVPFSIFLILALGSLFGGNYMLAAFTVTAAFALVGGLLTYFLVRKLNGSAALMAKTRESLRQDKEMISTKIESLRAGAGSRRAV